MSITTTITIEVFHHIVSDVVSYIEKKAIKEEGIYRIPGSDLQARELVAKYAKCETQNIFDVLDPFTITTMLKTAIRQLKSGVIPIYAYPGLKAIALSKQINSKVPAQALADYIKMLPDKNIQCLKILIDHLYQVAEHQQENKMGINNLIMVFAPSLLISGGNDAMQEMQDNPQMLHILFEALKS